MDSEENKDKESEEEFMVKAKYMENYIIRAFKNLIEKILSNVEKGINTISKEDLVVSI